jgi:hypothetical protein
MIIHGPSDLVEVQGRYGLIFIEGSKLRRGKAVDQVHGDYWIYTYIVYWSFAD